jgi:flavin-dependent dehydrogenase
MTADLLATEYAPPGFNAISRSGFGGHRPPLQKRKQTDCFSTPARAFSLLFRMDYDVVIVGGAFSGAATALMLKRRRPSTRVLIIEKTTAFDRKVGESTTEVSSCYMTRILGLTHHLGHHHLPKQGLRLWFTRSADQSFADCVELGARYGARLFGFQVDRATLDTHLLDQAVAAGCELLRPAKVCALELKDGGEQTLTIQSEQGTRQVRARWIVDASGRAAMIPRKLGFFRANTEHPINAVWARFTGTREWDSYEWREKFPEMANACRTGREWATNHLMGYGWWCWIIPLRGGDVSAGIVYDERIFQLPPGATLAQRLHDHLVSHPVGRAIFGDAKAIEGDVHAFSALPYWSEKVCGDGWAAVGDATGFIDPLYSPGLDFCSFTSYIVADMLAHNLAGEDVSSRISYYNEQYPITYRFWFESLYRDKYYYMGEGDLMAAALLLDVSSYYIGLVRHVYRDPECAFTRLPFAGRGGHFAATFMKWYSRRLVKIARRRAAAGQLGQVNQGWRELYDGFVPDFRLRKQLTQGLLRWWRAEWGNLFLSPRTAPQSEVIYKQGVEAFVPNAGPGK